MELNLHALQDAFFCHRYFSKSDVMGRIYQVSTLRGHHSQAKPVDFCGLFKLLTSYKAAATN
jgi:hypothetical protein